MTIFLRYLGGELNKCIFGLNFQSVESHMKDAVSKDRDFKNMVWIVSLS